MSERRIIGAALKSRESYYVVNPYIKDGDLSEQGKIIWRAIGDYYERDREAHQADPELISNAVQRGLTSPKHKEAFKELIADIANGLQTISPENVLHDYVEMHKEAVGARLASALLSNSKDINDLIEEYNRCSELMMEEDIESRVYSGLPIQAISQTYSSQELVPVWPESLNRRLDGGLIRGHHMVIFARPEMGKTLMMVNMCAGFLTSGLSVLYVGNEDPIQDIALRTICRLAERDRYAVLENPEQYYRTALELGYANFHIADLAPGTPAEIEELVQQIKPDVVIIDQLRNLAVKEDARVNQLEKAATSARNIAKKYGVVVISVTQAGDSASGKAVLEMGDVDSSNTGIPAQADVMVGIGASQDDYMANRRTLSLPKNKRTGKHDSWKVKVDPSQSKLIDAA